MKTISVPSDGVLVLVARALPSGPHVDVSVNTEWWQGAGKEHRKALFIAALDSLRKVGEQVIPEEFHGQDLQPGGPTP